VLHFLLIAAVLRLWSWGKNECVSRTA
jgi:hypothetical protein